MPTAYIVKDGYPLIFGCLAIAIAIAIFFPVHWAVLPFVLALFFTFFHRNPNRKVPSEADILVAPADGKVMEITEVYEDLFLHQECKKITIFMSVFDVHVNRSPMEGKITFRQYTCGEFLPAFKDSVGYENERHSIGIDNGKMEILVTQIAGLLARRIAPWTDLGDTLERGQRYGMIKFGSCVEVFMPKNINILVQKGEHVSSGETIIGRINNE